ncbi:hypothetical protein QUF58_10380 [Anaerolineales bacterium HSG24]|nr:hypothetical protein [Anaerolineales bacterium HSG24]
MIRQLSNTKTETKLKSTGLLNIGLVLSVVGAILFIRPQRLVKALLNLFQRTIVHGWIHPCERLLRFMSLDYASTWSPQLISRLTKLKDFGWLLVTLGRVQITRLEGDEWSVTLVNDSFSKTEKELRHVLFPTPPKIQHQGRAFLWNIPKRMPHLLQESDMVICELNRHLDWKLEDVNYQFLSPPWVRMGMYVNRPIQDIIAEMGKGRRQSLVKMQKVGFSCEFSQDMENLHLFYDKMYLPYINSRHQNRAIIEPYKAKKAMFDRGGLLIIKYQGQTVAAMLGETIGNTYIVGSLAVHEDHFDLFEKGVVLAIYWFAIDWAQRNQLLYVDYGLTRAQIFDKVFWAKLLWGNKVYANYLDDHSDWLFVSQTMPEPLKVHLNEIGFITIANDDNDDKARCIIFAQDNIKKTLKIIRRVSPRVGLAEPMVVE